MEHNWMNHDVGENEELAEDDQLEILVVLDKNYRRCPCEKFTKFVGVPNPKGVAGCEYEGGKLSLLLDIPSTSSSSI